MKVYFSVDMEGATGITGRDDVQSGTPAYIRFRKLLTQDVNATIEGALQGGAKKIVVNEAHDEMRNLLIEELHPKAELISGFTKTLDMMEGINEDFDAAFFIAYHARAGTADAILAHTMSSRVVFNLRVNGVLLGEFGLNALVAGYFGVPVALVTGDDKVVKEAKDLVGEIEGVITKKGIDTFVAQCLSPEESANQLREGSARALTRLHEFKPYTIQLPLKFEVEFTVPSMAANVTSIPGVTRETARVVSFISNDVLEGYKWLMAVLDLASVRAEI